MPTEHVAKWIRGDGGPLVVLQGTAALRWRGAAHSENAQGKDDETDYEAICRCDDGISVIRRHGRDMLVLSDSEFEACFTSAGMTEIVIVQCFGSDSTVDELVAGLRATPPSKATPFTLIDGALRLLVGADDGNGTIYGFSELRVFPGEMICESYDSREAQLAVLRPRE
jgi:hypothetical protein